MAAPSHVAPGQHVSLRALLATLFRPALLPHVALLVLSAIGGLMLIRIDPNAWGNPPHGLVALVHLIGFAWYLGLGYVRETGRLNRILLSDRRDAIALVRIFATMLAVISATTGLVLLAGRYLFGPERAWVEACADHRLDVHPLVPHTGQCAPNDDRGNRRSPVQWIHARQT